MVSYSPERISRPNLIQRWRVARQVGKVMDVFKILDETSNPAPKSKISRVSIGTAHQV